MQLWSHAACSRTPTASVHSVSLDTKVSSVIHVEASLVGDHDDNSHSEFEAEDFEDPNPSEWPHHMPDNNTHLSNETLMLMRSNLNEWLFNAFQQS